MAGNDVFLYSVPTDADSDDVRLRDPTTTGAGSPQTLTQTVRFDASDTFYGGQVNLVLSQTARFDASDTFYSAQINLSLNQGARFDDGTTFYGAQANLVLTQTARFTDTDTFYAASVVTSQILTQTARFDAPDTFYTASLDIAALPAGGTDRRKLKLSRKKRRKRLEEPKMPVAEVMQAPTVPEVGKPVSLYDVFGIPPSPEPEAVAVEIVPKPKPPQKLSERVPIDHEPLRRDVLKAMEAAEAAKKQAEDDDEDELIMVLMLTM